MCTCTYVYVCEGDWVRLILLFQLSCWFIFLYYQKLLEGIAKITNGMYVMVQNMEELSTFFRRQVLLSRFIGQFTHGKYE